MLVEEIEKLLLVLQIKSVVFQELYEVKRIKGELVVNYV